MPTYASMKLGYGNLWRGMNVTSKVEANQAAAGMIADKARYQAIEDATGVPWFWIAITHHRESNRSFAGVLHNGERIIGTKRKTKLVPKGRGPFESWNEAAIDALKLKRLDKIDDWPVERMLYEFERYNGWGYNGKINSPYVWAGTSKQQPGKYVADHVFDPKHMDTQLGAAAMLKQLAEADQSVAERISGGAFGADVGSETPGELSVSELVAILKAKPGVKGVMIEW